VFFPSKAKKRFGSGIGHHEDAQSGKKGIRTFRDLSNHISPEALGQTG
jgi:hypothetical protein